jgi:hypothetical protein
VFLCARVDAIEDFVSQIGSNICGKNNEKSLYNELQVKMSEFLFRAASLRVAAAS